MYEWKLSASIWICVIGCILECYVHEIGELSAGCYSLLMKSKEEGSSELHRSFVLCEVRVIKALCCNCLTKII
jgi:hypothetical protein